MCSLPSTNNDSFRRRLCNRVRRFRSRTRDSPTTLETQSPRGTQPDGDHPNSHSQVQDLAVQQNTVGASPNAVSTQAADEKVSGQPATRDEVESVGGTQDIWSAAFREAVLGLDKDIDVAILKSKNIEQIFRQLEEIDKDATHESAFLRGVKYLRSIQVPLEKFKLALDLASPLAGFDPTARTVFGVVTGVTAIAISFASADEDFAKQIGEMLNQISYIDGCDTLGQRLNQKDIHEVLVLVYGKMLEFYMVSFEILNRKGVKLVLKMALENRRLPCIVDDFLKHAEMLHKVVQSVTAEIVQDIKVMLYDQEIARWLGGDKIRQQSEYHATLGYLRADQACDFVLKHPHFMKWYRSLGSDCLLVHGYMGSGKSVTAAFLIEELVRRRNCSIPRPIVCYHYCRDDETGRIAYIISVLVLSLLEQLSGLKKIFHEWYKQNQADGNIEPAKDVRKLKQFLEQTLKSLDRPVFLVVDGLDECDVQSRTMLLDLIRASLSGSNTKFLLFSRPSEDVMEYVDEEARIDLFSDLHRDRVIVKHTVEKHLHYLSHDAKELLIEHLSSSAQGSAIWTKMVVQLVQDRKIRALAPMRRFLDITPLPSQLFKLYDALLLRCTLDDTENQLLATAALKILAVAIRPLSISELAWAVALATASPDVTTVAALADLVDSERVTSLIRPFIVLENHDDMNINRVRLVHHSIKEFVVQLDSQKEKDIPSQNLNERVKSDQYSPHLESYILTLCINYLLLQDIDQIEFFSEEQLAIVELPQETDLFEDDLDASEYDSYCTWEQWEKTMARYDPTLRGFGEFFVYASCHWLDHFGNIDIGALPDLQSIEALCAAGTTRLHNWTQQNCRPGCVVKPRFDFDSRLYDPLSITSLYGSEAMLYHMLQYSDFSTDRFLADSFIAASEQILLWGDLARLKILVLGNSHQSLLPVLEFWSLIINYWSHRTQRRSWDEVFSLVEFMPKLLVETNTANELLCMAASAGCLPLVKHLITQAQQDQELKNALLSETRHNQQTLALGDTVHQSIMEAVLGGRIDVVEFLLRQEGIEAPITRQRTWPERSISGLSSL